MILYVVCIYRIIVHTWHEWQMLALARPPLSATVSGHTGLSVWVFCPLKAFIWTLVQFWTLMKWPNDMVWICGLWWKKICWILCPSCIDRLAFDTGCLGCNITLDFSLKLCIWSVFWRLDLFSYMMFLISISVCRIKMQVVHLKEVL